MFTVLSMIVGFLSSLAPEFIKKWQDSSDKKHELELLKMQMQQATQQQAYKMDEIGINAYRDVVVAATNQQAEITAKASRWVIDLTASVRPVITYLFMIAFIGFKMAAFFAAINPELPWKESMTYTQAMLSVWGEDETALFGGIIAFWFGDRTIAKRRA